MASMQCYREETCQTKCYDDSFGQRDSDGMFLNKNHRASNHGGHYYSQSNGGHHRRSNHQAMSETQECYSETQAYYPDQYAMGKTHSAHYLSQSGYGGSGYHAMGMGYGHGHRMGHQMAHGMVSGGCHEKKMKNSYEFKKKSYFSNKRRDGNRSCSENESDSDCD